MMKTNTRWIVIAALTGTCLGGCRIDPGATDYAAQQFDFDGEDDTDEPPEFLPGPDPYQNGESRLIFGPFYEGAASDQILIDDQTNFFFVFSPGGSSSLDISPTIDRVEGFQADAFELTGTPFWGMSLSFFDGNPDAGAMPRPEDLSRWTTIHISFKSSDASFEDVSIGVASTAGESAVLASSYGYENDGEWHSLAIPTEDIELDFTQIVSPLIISGVGAGTTGDVLLVDNFYWTVGSSD